MNKCETYKCENPENTREIQDKDKQETPGDGRGWTNQQGVADKTTRKSTHLTETIGKFYFGKTKFFSILTYLEKTIGRLSRSVEKTFRKCVCRACPLSDILGHVAHLLR